MKMMAGALLAALGLFASCSKSGKDVQDPNQEGSTYVGITLSMGTNDLRDEDDNYNKQGTQNGKDEIKTIDVYVVDVASNVVSTGFYNKDNFVIDQTDGAPSIKITPKTAIRTTPGAKRVYALVNASAEVTQKLANANAAVFENVYNEMEQDFAIATLAKNERGKDVIMASNAKECALTVADGVTEAEALDAAAPRNRAKVDMKRVVARVVVTTNEETFQVMYSDGVHKMGTVKNISYAGAQGEKKFYIGQKVVAGLIQTPAYAYFPTVAADIWGAGKAHYDYSDLKEHTFDNNPRYATKINGALSVEQIGEKSLAQTLFMYEASHKYQTDPNNRDVNNYDGEFRRGNTPYVLVRALFVPDAGAFADGTTNYQEGQDFYLGANNKFYSTKENVTDPAKGGVAGQKYRHYVKGKVLYYAFVNPDKAPNTLDAPVFRNNIYHINIKGFKTIGTNWNPLFPEDPDNPAVPGTPDNPDPRPDDDPVNPNPFNPEDPNTPKETWMSVEMSVLAWTVHSYDIELSL